MEVRRAMANPDGLGRSVESPFLRFSPQLHPARD
jgi:hypothetical protein